jgi:phenylacetate-CoA ligase
MSAFALEPIERASVDELRALQLKRLQATLQHAYANSPVYRAKFDAAGVHPADCRSLADLAKFPFTSKSDLRNSYPFGMFAARAFMLRAAPPARRPWSATRRTTSMSGRR